MMNLIKLYFSRDTSDPDSVLRDRACAGEVVDVIVLHKDVRRAECFPVAT